MEIDPRGRFGENLINEILSNDSYFTIEYDGDANTHRANGIYDITINTKRVEIKTATIGTNKNTFQHENLKNEDKCDAYLLIDVGRDFIFLTFLRKDFNFEDHTSNKPKIPIFSSAKSKKSGATFHNRPGTDNFKLTLCSDTSLEFSKEKGTSVKIESDDVKIIFDFLKKFL